MMARMRTANCAQLYAFDAHRRRLVRIWRGNSMRMAESCCRCRFRDTGNCALIPAGPRIALDYRTLGAFKGT